MINWKLPTVTDPGFLRRRRELGELVNQLPTPENTDKLLEYLAQYVEGDDPLEQLLDASQEEYSKAIMVMMGLANTVNSKKEGRSVPQ